MATSALPAIAAPVAQLLGGPVAIAVMRVDADAVRQYAAAVHEHDPTHHDRHAARAAGFADVAAPPMFVAVYAGAAVWQALEELVDVAESSLLHLGQQFRWHAPVRAGDVVTTEVELDGAHDTAAGMRYALRSTSRNERGEAVSDGLWRILVRPKG